MSIPTGPMNGPGSLSVVRVEVDLGLLLHHEPGNGHVSVEGHPVGRTVAVLVTLVEQVVALVTVAKVFNLGEGAEGETNDNCN